MPKCIISLSFAAGVIMLTFAQAQERHIYWTNSWTSAHRKILRGDENGAAYEEIISARLPSVLAIAADGLYWADGVNHTMQRASLDGTSTAVVLSDIGVVADLAVDAVNKKLYWIEYEAGKIWRANFDGTEAMLVIGGLGRPAALAIDSMGGKLYWVEALAQKIQRANLDGTQVTDVLSVERITRGLALDVIEGKIYWLANNTRELKRANLDGSNIETVLSDIAPFDFTLEAHNRKIYLADVMKIVRVSFDGTGWEELVTGFAIGPTSLTLHASEGKMYWIDGWTARIQRANLDGDEVEDVLVGFVSPRGLALDVENEKVYWTGFGEILRANFDGSDVEYVVNVACGIGELSDIAIDPKERKMYWIRDSDCGGGSQIHRANLDGSNVQSLRGGGIIHHLALDLAERKLYWSDAGGRLQSRAIYRANLDGSGAEALIDSLNAPGGIAIDSQNRKVYWIEYPNNIYRASLDGTNIEPLRTGLSTPGEIALDVQNGKMYWTEGEAGKIHRANLDGTDIEDLFTGLNAPYRIALTFETPAVKVDESPKDLPTHIQLLQNYPNPFNAATTIAFDLNRVSEMTLKVFNLHGEEVAVLINQEKFAAGSHKIIWNAEIFPSGVYISRLQIDDSFVFQKKLVLLK